MPHNEPSPLRTPNAPPRASVDGYATPLSVEPGERVSLRCSARCASFTIEVARIGATRQVVWRQTAVAATDQPVPDRAFERGCGWSETIGFAIPSDWCSGFYEVTFTADDAPANSHPATNSSQAFFVVRAEPSVSASPDAPSAPANRILLVVSTNTYNAYNTFGGSCLYLGATKVSFERPIDRGFVTRPFEGDDEDPGYDGRIVSIEAHGQPGHERLLDYLDRGQYAMWCASSSFHNWERRFIRWAETNGFGVDVAISSDLETVPDLLDRYSLMCSVGHDEYWSWGMRDTVDAWVERGGNLAIFSGNTCFWQVRLDHEHNSMICFKGSAATDDPVRHTTDRHLLTSMWSLPRIGRPETSTIGLTFSRGGYHRIGWATPRSSGAYTVQRPEHWCFDGTDLRWGDSLGLGSYVVGYEVDGCAFTLEHGLPVPTNEDGAPETLTILATAPARLLSRNATMSEIPKSLWADPSGPGDLESLSVALFGDDSPANVARIAHNHCVIGCFTRGEGTVFNTGSTNWAYGLDADPDIQQITANVLTRLGGGHSGDT